MAIRKKKQQTSSESSKPVPDGEDRNNSLTAYRAWRADLMKEISNAVRRDAFSTCSISPDDQTGNNRLRNARRRVTAFREHIAWELQSSQTVDPAHAVLIRRALGLPPYLPLKRHLWMLLPCLVLAPLPQRFHFWWCRAVLVHVRTYEGRRHVFDRFIAPILPGRVRYSEGADCAMRQLPLCRTVVEYEDISWLEPGLIAAGRQLGLQSASEISAAFRKMRPRCTTDVLHALIEEGLVVEAADLAWIATVNLYDWQERREINVTRLRPMVRTLMSAGVPRQAIIGILERPYQYDAARLAATVALFRSRAMTDIAGLLKALGERLWITTDEQWLFVLDEIGARTTDEVKRLRPLLDITKPAPVEVIRWMRQRGAALEDLTRAQDLLLEFTRVGQAPMDSLDVLAAHAVPMTLIAHCADYLLRRDVAQLRQYLDILVHHGYSDVDAILAFRTCYGSVGPVMLAKWLGIVGSLNDQAFAARIADWVVRANARPYHESFAYLAERITLTDHDAMEQAMLVLDLSPALVRYVVEERGIGTLKALREWYYTDAWGAQDYMGGSTYDQVDRMLMEDAFLRKNFAVLEGNRMCLQDALDRRVQTLVPYPRRASEADWAAYRCASDAVIRTERQVLQPVLAAVLPKTYGVLLRSLVNAAWDPAIDIDQLLSLFNPLIEQLIQGQGPTGDVLTELETEAVALVYRVPPSIIRERWSSVIGRKHEWAASVRGGPYMMQWQRQTRRISRPLDRDSLRALGDAAQYAERFERRSVMDVCEASRHLRARQLSEPSADTRTFHRHLGVLLAAAANDGIVNDWLKRRFASLAQLSDETVAADREISDLHDFFRVALPDALATHLDRFVDRFDDGDARHLAIRLGADRDLAIEGQGRALLGSTLLRTKDKALDLYLRWSRREKKKFKNSRDDAQHLSRMHAFVSTHPAAFFAKEAAGLCSRSNTAMWLEPRHAHLVVFDPLSRTLGGLAMLYHEVIVDLDPTRPSLIIRAINPTDAMMAGHDATSIVDAFFTVAVEIAQAHGLAGVAFPSDGGQDFLSNRSDIERDIKRRYIKNAGQALGLASRRAEHSAGLCLGESPRPVQHEFYAYEHGVGRVQTLYVIWRPAASTSSEVRQLEGVNALGLAQ
ncbi:hypothetical protein [Collimonas silvisoli]|uniref:hypothetical protein n=1 Tax=Collimonas silvisoli TaxID=2825884 RepID=UPI001B8B61CA|nr:hypothetical protein [Collimonas silvisoli]